MDTIRIRPDVILPISDAKVIKLINFLISSFILYIHTQTHTHTHTRARAHTFVHTYIHMMYGYIHADAFRS
jgi:hypothetical protein